jgi:hypothetical protein
MRYNIGYVTSSVTWSVVICILVNGITTPRFHVINRHHPGHWHHCPRVQGGGISKLILVTPNNRPSAVWTCTCTSLLSSYIYYINIIHDCIIYTMSCDIWHENSVFILFSDFQVAPIAANQVSTSAPEYIFLISAQSGEQAHDHVTWHLRVFSVLSTPCTCAVLLEQSVKSPLFNLFKKLPIIPKTIPEYLVQAYLPAWSS